MQTLPVTMSNFIIAANWPITDLSALLIPVCLTHIFYNIFSIRRILKGKRERASGAKKMGAITYIREVR